MNASLQMLFSVPEFMLALSRYNGFAEPPELIQKLIGVWRNLNNKENGGGSFKPRALKLAIDAVTKKFQGSFQRDAHEFLGDLIDCIHEQNVANKSSTPNDSQGDERIEPTQDSSSTTTSLHYLEPADEFFRLNVEVNLKCMSCGYSR
jgi:ubiquitin C-terminal hydrolase